MSTEKKYKYARRVNKFMRIKNIKKSFKKHNWWCLCL